MSLFFISKHPKLRFFDRSLVVNINLPWTFIHIFFLTDWNEGFYGYCSQLSQQPIIDSKNILQVP